MVALLVAVLVSLLGQSGAAFAATGVPSPAASTPAPKAAPKPNVTPAPAAPKVDEKAERAAAAKAVSGIVHSHTDSCSGGALQPDTVYTCSYLGYGADSYTVALPQANDLVSIQAVSTTGAYLQLSFIAPDNTDAPCTTSVNAMQCHTRQAGTYTLKVGNYGAPTGFSVAYNPLLSDPGCTAVAPADRQLGAPTALHATFPAGSAGLCWSLDLATGDVLRTSAGPGNFTESVYDATGTQVCSADTPSSGLDCTLKGTAPYRVRLAQGYGNPTDATLTFARLSSPEGCTAVDFQPYGALPDLTPTTRCRSLHVPVKGQYDFGPVSTGTAVSGRLYKLDGSASCNPYNGPCTLDAGDYTWAVDTQDAAAGAFGLYYFTTAEARGCTATTDTGFSTGPATGSFSGAGQRLCLTLPTASGNGVYLLGDSAPVAGAVYDANGVAQCSYRNVSYTACALTGPAPFHLALWGDPTASYKITVQQTGDGTGCALWPQSAFGGEWGVEVKLTAQQSHACLSIPADSHSAAETIDFANTTNTLNANVRIYDATGKQACATMGSSTAMCVLPAGPLTAILEGVGGADTYHLVRRDISPTANCPVPTNTTVGSPSTALTFGSALDARCVRVSAAATDKFWLAARTARTADKSSAVLSVVDASGKPVCSTLYSVGCNVTGSTSYTAVVSAENYQSTPITTHVDAWKVGTADGWAPECTANSFTLDGFAPRNGVLSENSTGYCAVVDMKASQSFDLYGTSGADFPDSPWVGFFHPGHWTGSYPRYQCTGTYGAVNYRCSTDASAEAGQALVLVTPNTAATPVEYTLQAVCEQGCTNHPAAPDVSSLSPATGPAETTTQVVLHGTGLTLGTQLKLAQNGSPSSAYQQI